jgi:hypothetical protein
MEILGNGKLQMRLKQHLRNFRTLFGETSSSDQMNPSEKKIIAEMQINNLKQLLNADVFHQVIVHSNGKRQNRYVITYEDSTDN